MDDCRFCTISTTKKDYIISENGRFMAFLAISPLSKGHFLVIPKIHYKILGDMPRDEFLDMTDFIIDISSKIIDILKADGMNIGINSGSAAGQQIDHLHAHIVPRYIEDKTIVEIVNKNAEQDKSLLSETFDLIVKGLKH